MFCSLLNTETSKNVHIQVDSGHEDEMVIVMVRALDASMMKPPI